MSYEPNYVPFTMPSDRQKDVYITFGKDYYSY